MSGNHGINGNGAALMEQIFANEGLNDAIALPSENAKKQDTTKDEDGKIAPSVPPGSERKRRPHFVPEVPRNSAAVASTQSPPAISAVEAMPATTNTAVATNAADTAANRRHAQLPDGIEPASGEQVGQWIQDLEGLPSQLKSRKGLGAGLFAHKPSSPRYQYAKHQMNATERTQFTAALKEMIERRTARGDNADDLVDLFLCLQHARLRTHTRQERLNYRRNHVSNGMEAATIAAYTAAGTFGIASPFVVTEYVQKSRKLHRDYYRSEARPEYVDAFNDIVEMLRTPDAQISEAGKQKIAGTLLDEYIRGEKLLTPIDANRVLASLSDTLPDRYQQHGKNVSNFRKLGSAQLGNDRSTPEQQLRVIAWATREGESANHVSRTAFEQRQRQLRRMQRQQQSDQGVKSSRPLDANIKRAYKRINGYRTQRQEVSISVPANLDIYNKPGEEIRNHSAFSRLLERVEGDARNVLKKRAVEVYQNV